MIKKVNAKGKAVLLIGDSHLPYEHPDYLAFCKAVSKKHRCKIHIHMGDFEDQHAISFHDSDVDLFSAGQELEEVIYRTESWYKAFPKLKTLHSNHGSLVIRNFKKHGIPMKHLKSLGEIYSTPKWTWYENILLATNLGNVYLAHGEAAPYQKLAKEQGCSAVQGHYHGKFEVTWSTVKCNERFNMFTGCGIDRESMAFAYGKTNIPQPALGCGAIDEKGIPHIEKMILNTKGRWTGEI